MQPIRTESSDECLQMSESTQQLLEVQNLKTHFFTDDGVVKAVNGVDLSIRRGESLGVVGESGCGKSVTAQSIMQIVPSPPGKIVDGKILFHTEKGVVDVASLKSNGREMRSIRGKEVSMIFQEPMNSLSPVHTIGSQIAEGIRLHQRISKNEARERTVEMLDKVRISRPAEVFDEYTYQLSGGMRQRAMIALSLACGPALLIADEPTTALDVTVQAQILRLIRDLQQDFGMGLMLITHDLGVIAQTVDLVAVVYLGKVVEYGTLTDVFLDPKHPYTKALFASIPRIEEEHSLKPISGSVPDPYQKIPGCPFAGRCDHVHDPCNKNIPALVQQDGKHSVRCFLYHTETESGDE